MKRDTAASKRPPVPDAAADAAPRFELCLYLAGSTAASARALVNTRRFCERHLPRGYVLEIIDISLHPQRVQAGQIIAAPTLVKMLPLPVRRFIGDMSQTERLLRGFELRAGTAPSGDHATPAQQ